VQIRIIHRDIARMTKEDWRSQPDLVKSATNVVASQTFKLMMDVIRNDHLASYYIPVATTEERAAHQLRCEGYNLALKDLEALAVYEKPKVEIEAEFAPEELEPKVA
jgi:hypothetical protein